MEPQYDIHGDDFLHPPINPNTDRLVYFETPFNTEIVNKSYRQVREDVLTTVMYMKNSGLYKEINVEMGGMTKNHLLQFERDTKKQMLLTQKQKLLEQIEKLKKATDEKQVEQLSRQIVIDTIPVSKDNFVPSVFISGVKKFPVYATIAQEISKEGRGGFKTKIGIRSIFTFLDRIELTYEKAISRHDIHEYGLKWMTPYKNGSHISLGVNYDFRRIFVGLNEGVTSWATVYAKDNYRAELDVASRMPYIDTYYNHYQERYMKANYMKPSTKKSIKFWYQLINTVRLNQVMEGTYADISTQLAVPLTKRDSRFVRVDFNYRRYFDLFRYSFGNINPFMKNMMRQSNFQFAFSANSIMRKGQFCVSDCLSPLTARGFETLDTPNLAPIQIRSAFKWNLYNFPLLCRANIRAFTYLSKSVSLQKINTDSWWKLQPNIRAAIGFGAFYELAPFARLEVIYNIAQFQNRQTNKLANFQIRIGIND